MGGRDIRTRQADGWWNGCAVSSKNFRSNRSRCSWLHHPTRCALSACLSVSPSASSVCLPVCLPRLSVHPACGILNFWTWPTAVRRLWGETWDQRLGAERLQTWRPESETWDSGTVGLSSKPVYGEQSAPLDGSCKQSELTAWQALSHEKWMMIMTTPTTTMKETSQEREVAPNCRWGNAAADLSAAKAIDQKVCTYC